MHSIILALSLAFTSQPVEPASEQPEEAVPAPSQREAEEKRICRNIRPDMSSRRKERVCMTSEQWREFNRGN